jgi:FlaA1/EpsC-like NDP-sugar epimerase
LKNWIKPTILVTFDVAMAAVSYILAFLLRFNFNLEPLYSSMLINTIFPVIVAQSLSFAAFGLYRRIWRYASLRDLFAIARGVTAGIGASLLVLFMFYRLENIPRSVLIIDWFVLMILVGGGRILYRAWREGLLLPVSSGTPALIVGAGAGGTLLLRWIQANRYVGIRVVGLVDDDPAKHRIRLMGNRVLGAIDNLRVLIEHHKIDRVLIAIPSASGRTMRRILEQCEQTDVQVHTLPPLEELISGQLQKVELRPVEIEDLLGRSQVEIDEGPIDAMLRGRRVLVTGAGGSIGSELCRQIAMFGPAQLVIVDQSEFFLYRIEIELRETFPTLRFVSHLADINDLPRFNSILREAQPEIILHAAAYKHVPILEANTREAFLNNAGGTLRIARAAIEHGVGKFVMISTDKAVNPTSILGATKRLAEMLCCALQGNQNVTEFITVRFGNVLESTGSVIPRFREQIESGGPVTVTDPEVTRFFMSIGEAAKLVLLAAATGEGGEIYVLDMGEPIKISELAKALIRLAGKVPGRDIEIIYTGLRPGEKLKEELFKSTEENQATNHSKIFRAKSVEPPRDILLRVTELIEYANRNEVEFVKEIRALVPEYRPNSKLQ